MMRWEYLSVDLGSTPTKEDDAYYLNLAGARGWELVGILPPQRAIFKRPLAGSKSQKIAVSAPSGPEAKSKPGNTGR